MRYDSDVDTWTDFNDPIADDEAWQFAERACWDLGLEPDIRPLALCTERFVTRATPDMQVDERCTMARCRCRYRIGGYAFHACRRAVLHAT